MMVGLAERRADLIVELVGQAPHDMVPGAYIAQAAGAVLTALNGTPISAADMAISLLRPADSASRRQYILAANAQLSADALRLVGSNG
jgi:fructose-1,6-bisphosphatase/inositol monophosphatase family enzyme